MKIYTLERMQKLPMTLEQAWDFFSDPSKLPAITPNELGFNITSPLPEKMYAGLILTYKVKPIFGIPVTWMTEITQVREPFYFADEQRIGPYRLWHHQHFFSEIEGGIAMQDLIYYALPYGPLGRLIHALKIDKQLNYIFDYREDKLIELFGEFKSI